jgi:hypothetical protein
MYGNNAVLKGMVRVQARGVGDWGMGYNAMETAGSRGCSQAQMACVTWYHLYITLLLSLLTGISCGVIRAN